MYIIIIIIIQTLNVFKNETEVQDVCCSLSVLGSKKYKRVSLTSLHFFFFYFFVIVDNVYHLYRLNGG